MQHLTLADEIVVLVLDDSAGAINSDFLPVANVAVAAGILMELALRRRIDTDQTSLFIIDSTPTGDTLLDEILDEIKAEADTHSSAWWIDSVSMRHDGLIDRVLHRLVSAGVLQEEERTFLWVFSHRAYPQVTGREEREAKARLMGVLFKDELPDPRDTLLLGLANATGALSKILSDDEMRKVSPRIAKVVALEEIGRSVGAIADEIWDAQVIANTTYPQ
jgi:hypothetical protein